MAAHIVHEPVDIAAEWRRLDPAAGEVGTAMVGQVVSGLGEVVDCFGRNSHQPVEPGNLGERRFRQLPPIPCR